VQITLEQREIEEATKLYIKQHGLDFGTIDPKINLIAGRGPQGITANIELSNMVTLGAAEVEILPNKKEANPELFEAQDEPEDIVEEETPAPKKKTAPKKKKKPAPKKPEPELVEDELPVNDESVFNDEPDDNPFGSDDSPVEDELDGDSLFADAS